MPQSLKVPPVASMGHLLMKLEGKPVPLLLIHLFVGVCTHECVYMWT